MLEVRKETMVCNKKGDLAISTNAIVVLIIAVIMLGLIIGFVTKGFGAVEKKFLGDIEGQETPPSPATISQPITISSTNKIASPGELVGFKVNIFNVDSTAITEYPTATCLDAAGTSAIASGSEQTLTKTIDPGTSASFTYFFKVESTTTKGVYLCQMLTTGLATQATADFTLRVQ